MERDHYQLWQGEYCPPRKAGKQTSPSAPWLLMGSVKCPWAVLPASVCSWEGFVPALIGTWEVLDVPRRCFLLAAPAD